MWTLLWICLPGGVCSCVLSMATIWILVLTGEPCNYLMQLFERRFDI